MARSIPCAAPVISAVLCARFQTGDVTGSMVIYSRSEFGSRPARNRPYSSSELAG